MWITHQISKRNFTKHMPCIYCKNRNTKYFGIFTHYKPSLLMGITLKKVVPLKEMTIKRWIGGMRNKGNQKFIYKEKWLIFWYNERWATKRQWRFNSPKKKDCIIKMHILTKRDKFIISCYIIKMVLVLFQAYVLFFFIIIIYYFMLYNKNCVNDYFK